MTRRIIGIVLIVLAIILLFLFSCSEPVAEKRNSRVYYVITHGDDTYILNDSTVALHPPWYGNHNFVLGDSGRIFYHSRFNLNPDMEYCIHRPPRINMLPGHFKEIKYESLNLFMLRNVADTADDGRPSFATISYRADTIINPGYKLIAHYLDSTGIKHYTRNWTEEEKFTLTAGLNKKTYYTDSVRFEAGFCEGVK